MRHHISWQLPYLIFASDANLINYFILILSGTIMHVEIILHRISLPVECTHPQRLLFVAVLGYESESDDSDTSSSTDHTFLIGDEDLSDASSETSLSSSRLDSTSSLVDELCSLSPVSMQSELFG